MIRQRDLPFALRLCPARANWLPLEVRVGELRTDITASGVVAEDPVTGLVRIALLASSGFGGDATVGFWTEPEGYWLTAVVSGRRAALELAFTRSMHPGVPRGAHRDPGQPLASCELSGPVLALTIWRAVRASEADLCSAHESGAWSHAFPDRTASALTRLLVERGVLHDR